MKIEEILKIEIERLKGRNDLLEQKAQGAPTNLVLEEQIQKNALAMCEIAKAGGFMTQNMLKQISEHLVKDY